MRRSVLSPMALAPIRALFASPSQRKARAILDCGLFDPAHYRAQLAPGRAGLGDAAAALHFHTTGWANLLDPSPDFSTADYLMMNGDVAAAGLDPLLHYVEWGRAEGRQPTPAPTQVVAPLRRPVARAPRDADWQGLAARRQPCSRPDIVVIVPVYKGVDETLRCLFSVLDAPVATPFRLVVVDDHSPEPAISSRLQWLSTRGLIDLVRTPVNGGFVRACNLGMSRDRDHDVVFLNADTEVFGDWLDRLSAAARHDSTIGTLTPFSNNAEICSYPSLCRDNSLAIELDDRELDSLMAHENAGETVDLPTGVGFCLYVKRACLDETGRFDAETFGLGYGEENDFCRRAARAGWRNVLAADVFVRHHGGRSFGAAKAARLAAAITAVEDKHPGYLQLVARFIAEDPVEPLRARIDAARIRRRIGSRRAMLFVGHNRGGGTERHLQDMAALLEANDTPVLFARPDPANRHALRIADRQIRCQPNAPTFDMRDAPGLFAAALTYFGITHVHIHHLVDYDDAATDYLRLACAAAGIRYDFTVHDYLAICPRITLTDEAGAYCGEPAGEACQTCLRRCGSDFGTPSIWAWRDRFDRFLRSARHVFTPTDDVAQRLARHFPAVRLTTRAHPNDAAQPRRHPRKAWSRGTRQVGLIGALAPHKGSELFRACATRAADRGLPLHFTLLGFTDRDKAFLDLPNVTIGGAYRERELLPRLAALAPDLIWYPALWPETYSYTLDAAFSVGILPVAFDFGAPAERIRHAGFGRLLPLALMSDVDAMLEALLSTDVARCGAPPGTAGTTYATPLRSYYGLVAASAA